MLEETKVDQTASIGIIGDFDEDRPAHRATNDALNHAASRLSAQVNIMWLPTPLLLTKEGPRELEQFDGLWAAPGSPYRSLEGALRGIQLARELDRPFFGT